MLLVISMMSEWIRSYICFLRSSRYQPKNHACICFDIQFRREYKFTRTQNFPQMDPS